MPVPYPSQYALTQDGFFTASDAAGTLYRVFNAVGIEDPNLGNAYLQTKEWTGTWAGSEWSAPVAIPGLEGRLDATASGGVQSAPFYSQLLAFTAAIDGHLYLLYKSQIYYYLVDDSDFTYYGIFFMERSPGGVWSSPVLLLAEYETPEVSPTYPANIYYVRPMYRDEAWRMHLGTDGRLYVTPEELWCQSGGFKYYPPVFSRSGSVWLPMEIPDPNVDDSIQQYYYDSTHFTSTRDEAVYYHGLFYQTPAWNGAFVCEKKTFRGPWGPRILVEGDHIQPDYAYGSIGLSESQHIFFRPYSGFMVAATGLEYVGVDPQATLMVVKSSDFTYSDPVVTSFNPLEVQNTISQRFSLRYGGEALGDFTIEGLDLDTSEGQVLRRVEVINSGGAFNGGQITASCAVGSVSIAIELPGDTMQDAISRGMSPVAYIPAVEASGSFFFWLKWTAPTPRVYGTNEVTITFEIC